MVAGRPGHIEAFPRQSHEGLPGAEGCPGGSLLWLANGIGVYVCKFFPMLLGFRRN